MIKQLWIDIKYVGRPRKRLMHHILNDNLRRVEKIIKSGVSPNPTAEEIGKGSNLFWGELVCPPLLAAVRSGYPEMVKMLLIHADPTISVPRQLATLTCETLVENVWHINALDYLIEFARGKPKALRWRGNFHAQPLNHVKVKMNDYVEIYKILRTHIHPSEASLQQLNCSCQDSFYAHLKHIEEYEICCKQKERILIQIDHTSGEKISRKL